MGAMHYEQLHYDNEHVLDNDNCVLELPDRQMT